MILINSSPKNALKIFQPFLPIFVPVGVGSLLEYLPHHGIEAQFIDEQVEDVTPERVERLVAKMPKPYIFGFSVLTAAYKSALEVSKWIRRVYPESVIVFGGLHPTALPDGVMANSHIDFVIRGEGERPLAELYAAVKNSRDYSAISNLSYRAKNGQVVHNPVTYMFDGFDDSTSFPYHLFDNKKYDLGFVLSSRGCPYNCIFCSNRVSTGKKYRFKSVESIILDLEKLRANYGKEHVLFLDDNLLVDKARIYKLIDGLKSRGLHKEMKFNFQARGDNVDRRLLEDLYGAGFRSVFFGLETASDGLMRIIKKGETVAQCKEAVIMAKGIGFHVSATFIFGLPGETFHDRVAAINLSRELNLDMVRFNNATPYPGTEMYEMAKAEKRLNVVGEFENFNSVSTFIENPFKPIPFSYVPQGNTESQIRRDLLYEYFFFYLDICRLKRIFSDPGSGVGWFNAGEKLSDFLKKIPGLTLLASMLGIKFLQLFYYTVVKRGTSVSLAHFLKIFRGLPSGLLENQ